MPFAGLGGGFGAGDIVAYLGIGNTKDFENKLKKAQGDVERTSKKMNMALNMVAAAGAAIFVGAVAAAASFEKQMADVNTLLRDSSPFPQMKKDVLGLAKTMPVSLDTLTSGLYDLISAGSDASTSINSLKLAAEAATAGVAGVDVAVRAGMSTLNAYGLETIGAKNETEALTKIYDLQFSTIEKGVIRYEQLASSIGTALPAARGLKVSIEELYGSVAFLTKAGQSAEMATTNLSRAFQSFVEKEDNLAKAGIKIWGPDGSFRGMGDVIGQLAEKMKGLTTEQTKHELKLMGFDIRAGRAIESMISNYSLFKQTLDDVADSSGAAERAYQKQLNTFSSQVKILGNILKTALIDLGNKYLPKLKELVKLLTENPEKVAVFVENVGKLVIVLGGLAIVAKIVIMVNNLKTALVGLRVTSLSLGAAGGPIMLLAGAFIALNEAAKFFDKKNIENIGNTESVEALRQNLKKLEGQLATNKEGMKYAGMATGGFAKDNVKLGNMIQATKKRIEELEKATNKETEGLQSLAIETGNAAAGTDALGDSMKNAGDKISKNVSPKIKDLFMSMDDAVKPQSTLDQLQEKWNGVTEESKKLTEHVKGIRGEFRGFPSDVKPVTEHIKKLDDEIGKSNKNWSTYLFLVQDIINDLPFMKDASQTAKEGVGLLATTLSQLLDGSVDPVTLALKAFALAVHASTEVIVLAQIPIDEITSSLGGFYDAALKARNVANDFMTNAGETEELSGLLEMQAELMSVIQHMEETGMPKDMLNKYYAGLNEVNEKINELIGNYKELNAEMARNNHLMQTSVTIAADNGGTNDIYSGPPISGIDKKTNFFQEFLTRGKNAIDEINKYMFLGIGANATDFDGLVMTHYIKPWMAYLTTLDPSSPAFATGMAGLRELWDLYNSWVNPAIKQGADYAKEFSDGVAGIANNGDLDKINKSVRESSSDWEKYSEYVGSTADKVDGLTNDTFDLNTELSNQVYLINQLTLAYENWLGYTFDQYDEYLRQLGRFDKEGIFDPSGPLFTALQRLLDFGIDLDDTNVDEQIAVWIRQVQTFLETLDPDSAAYQALKAALDELIQKFIAMGGSIEAAFDSTVRLQNKLKGLKNVAMPQIGVGPIPGGSGGFHTGGLVTAHNGLLNSGDEVMAKLQRGEAVINRAVVNQYGANAFMELNRTGSMGGFQESNQQSENHVYVDIHNAGPMAFAEVTEQVYPRIKEKQRNYEPGRNPYSQ